MAELKKLPDDVLSFDAALYEVSSYDKTSVFQLTVSSLHTRRLAVRLNPLISQEVMDAMTRELPQSGEWEEVDINAKMSRIIAIVSGRIFVGPELCRSEEYIDMAINYTIEVMTAVYVIGLVPTWLRPLVAPYLPQVKQLTKRLKNADEILLPVVNARREAENKPDDLMQWIIDAETKAGSDVRDIARTQLSITMAAIHTTTLTTVNIGDPRSSSGDNGEFGSAALQNMKKLDSLFKETARFYPMSAGTSMATLTVKKQSSNTGPVAFQRKALKPFVLSNGQVIPAGVIVEVPAGCIYADDEFFEAPEVFDHLRYYKLRQSKGLHAAGTKAAEVVANSQFVSVSESSLNFGYGRHACPGRFFAVNEMKMIMANILLHYEVKNPDGMTERHKNVRSGAQLVPDPTKKIMIRKIK
ncbi:cytochrome P450 monooxygenase ATR2 [Colletotrichum liriopes]|uniref:Cytochrome P450 monooxygenase ATR2 n=1 Tax=Colletotrichum liriopes TaxID=708192 RepID=A0AA37LWU9_9PEZI|nr:cytochrome P450 monooxygenase ATR2 [Colletotrichum liriopes]